MKKQLTEAEIKRRQRKRKIRKRSFFSFVLVLLLIGAGVFGYLLKTRLFPIKKVAVEGRIIYEPGEIISAGGISDKTPIMSITERSLKKTLQKKLPYVETVRIKRNFPDSVVITVGDAKEVFAVKSEKEYFTLSESLRVLARYPELPENKVEIKAKDLKLKIGETVDFSSARETELFDLLYNYTKEKGIKLNGIDISNTVHITVFVEDKFEVNLGSDENIKEKINHLSGMVKEIGERKGRINLEMWSKTDSKGTFIEKK